MVAENIAHAVTSVFVAVGVYTLWYWWTSDRSNKEGLWSAVLYFALAYATALAAGI